MKVLFHHGSRGKGGKRDVACKPNINMGVRV